MVLTLYSLIFIMRFHLLIGLIASSLLSCSNASSAPVVGSFYTTNGPVVVSLDRGSGELSYNIYGQQGYNAMQSVVPPIAPSNITAMAITGYQYNQSIYVIMFLSRLYEPILTYNRPRYFIRPSTTVLCNKLSSAILSREFVAIITLKLVPKSYPATWQLLWNQERELQPLCSPQILAIGSLTRTSTAR